MSLPRPVVAASRLLQVATFVARSLSGRLTPPQRAAVPVVSVGNIACGGTGKTPTVAALARTLRAAGCRPAVLTRGYGRRGRDPVIVAQGTVADWREVGDEPALLAVTLGDVPIVVDADRVRGAAAAVAEGATHLVLDDGFQHFRLARDLDVVVVDAADPLSRRSPRREGPRALGRADAVVVANGDDSGTAAAAALVRQLAPRATVVVTRTVVRRILGGDGPAPADALRGVRVMAVAGIAAPQRFLATLRRIGAAIVRHRFFADHHPFTAAEVTALLAEAERENLVLVMTGKDAVKLSPELASRIRWPEIDVACVEGSFEDLLRPLLQKLG